MAIASTTLYDTDDFRADHHALIIDPTLDPTAIHNNGQEAVVNRGYFGLDNNDQHNDDSSSENSPEKKAKQMQSRLFYENMATICEQAHQIEQDYYMDTYDPYWNAPIVQHHNDWSYFDPEGKLEGVETWEEMVEAAPENFVDVKASEDSDFGMCSITDEYAQKLYGTPDPNVPPQPTQTATTDSTTRPLIKTDVNMSEAFAGSANPDTTAATQSAPAAITPQKPALQIDAAMA